jgi:hypothetical protein
MSNDLADLYEAYRNDPVVDPVPSSPDFDLSAVAEWNRLNDGDLANISWETPHEDIRDVVFEPAYESPPVDCDMVFEPINELLLDDH